MTTPLSWPTNLVPSAFDFGLTRQVVAHRSDLNGMTQSADMLSQFWTATMTFAPRARVDGGALEAIMNQLMGGAQKVYLWHFARPVPIGTMRGSPTLSASAAQFANTFSLTGCGANTTLVAGDLIGINGQIMQVAADAVASSGGAMSITTTTRLRSSLASGASVTWNMPTARFISMDTGSKFSYSPDGLSSTSFAFQESV